MLKKIPRISFTKTTLTPLVSIAKPKTLLNKPIFALNCEPQDWDIKFQQKPLRGDVKTLYFKLTELDDEDLPDINVIGILSLLTETKSEKAIWGSWVKYETLTVNPKMLAVLGVDSQPYHTSKYFATRMVHEMQDTKYANHPWAIHLFEKATSNTPQQSTTSEEWKKKCWRERWLEEEYEYCYWEKIEQ